MERTVEAFIKPSRMLIQFYASRLVGSLNLVYKQIETGREVIA